MKTKTNTPRHIPAVMLIILMLFTATAMLGLPSPMAEGAGAGNALVVTNGNDAGDGSLRAALTAAEDGDTIRFDPSVTAVTLTSGEILFDLPDITIDGGAGVTIQRIGASSFRLLNSTAPAGTLTLKGLTIENGAASGDGGGVRAVADAVLTNCIFTGNTATSGGGIYAGGSITLINCGFADNSSLYGTVYSDNVIADNTTFFANSIASPGTETGVVDAGVSAVLRHCTFTCNEQVNNNVYNVYAGSSVSADNCLMTEDLLKGNCNLPLGGSNLLGTGTDDYAAWFGNNTFTFGYIMPLSGIAGGAAVITGHERDAAGNLRASANCLFGAVNWTAKSWIVTNSSDGGAGSLRQCVTDADNDGGAENWRVVYFDSHDSSTGGSTFNIQTGSEIIFSKDIVIYGRLGIDGAPEITVDATYKTWRVFNQIDSGSSQYFGLAIKNGRTTGSNSGGGIHSNGNVTAQNCDFDGNRTGSTGGGIYAGGAVTLMNCIFAGNNASSSGGGVYSGGTAVLENCIFTGNGSTSAGGGVYGNSNTSLTNCAFTNNRATGGNGGGVRSWGPVTATDCIFTGNETTNATNGNGGGIWTNNNAFLTGCVFAGNTARVAGGGVSAHNGSLMVLTNCTFTDNTATDGGGIDCATKTYLFHLTITNNRGGGIYADSGRTAYLYNCIVTGNTNAAGTALLQTYGGGTVNYTAGRNLIEGIPIQSGPTTHRRVFGLNVFDPATGTKNVLTNGIAAGTAAAVTISDILGYSTLSSGERMAVDNALAALAFDQTGADRAKAGAVTYGAVEESANSLIGIAVGTDPAKTTYAIGETIDLTGTLLTLEYTNGTDSGVSYTEPGMTNTSESVDTHTVGDKPVHFTFLGVTTTGGTCLNITVTDSTLTAVTSGGGPSMYGEDVTFYAHVTPGHAGSGVPSGTVTFYDGSALIGTAACDESGVASLLINSLSLGGHNITAAYGGDSYYSGSSSAAGVPHTVNKADTALVVAAIIVETTQVTAIAHLAVVPPGYDTLAGKTVSFYVDGVLLGQSNSDGTGGVYFTISMVDLIDMGILIVGEHLIKAVFEGSAYLNGTESANFVYDIYKADTEVSVSVTPGTSVHGETVTITATLSILDIIGDTANGKLIIFYNGATVIGSDNCNSLGVASISVPLPFGINTISAKYDGNVNMNGSTGKTEHDVDRAQTGVSIAVAPASPAVYGQSVTITATLSVVLPGSEGDLSGKTIIFYDGADIIGTGSCDLSGVASLLIPIQLSVGSHAISAEFAGDASLLSSASASTAYVVNKATTDTQLTGPALSSVYGQSVTFSAAVVDASTGLGIPTGDVEFYDGGIPIGTATLDASGQAAFSTSALSAGPHTITVEYMGDDNYDTSQDNIGVVHTVIAADTAISLTADLASSAYGQEVTFIASVDVIGTGLGVPTGDVEFYDNGVPIGTAPLDASGQAALSVILSSVGSRTITASYIGDGNYDVSGPASLGHEVTKANTGTSLSADPASSVFGGTVTFTATVEAAGSGSGTPTGTVEFYDGSSLIGSDVLDINGKAVLSTAALIVGTHPITAVYGGDAEYNTSGTVSLSYIVSEEDTATSLSSDLISSVYGQTVTFTATVTAAGAGTPTGDVCFYIDGILTDTVALDINGEAVFSTAALSVGIRPVKAAYIGDGYYNASESALDHTVSKADTVTTLSSNMASSVHGQTVTFTATVTVIGPGSGIPGDEVEFYDGGVPIGGGILSAGGIAVFSTSALDAGARTITAVYGGDYCYATSGSAPVSLMVSPADTTASIISAPNPSLTGASVTFTATVTAVLPSTGIPVGTVEFYDDGVLIGTAALDASGKATLATAALGLGIHPVTAEYLGNSNFNASASHLLEQRVVPSLTTAQYIITATSSQGATMSPEGKVTVSRGGSATFFFSAATVTVDGMPLSPEDVAKGYYTFRNVAMSHTIDARGTGPRAVVTLSIEIKDGDGRVEYSINGSPFVPYTETVSLQGGSSVELRAYAGDGYQFKEWRQGAAVYASSEISLEVNSSIGLDLYFTEDGGGFPWLIAGIALFLILLLLLLLWRRRKEDEVEDGTKHP
ncbi:MAG: Ig-like domain repeat protein [Methanomassiliicoccaceae archaeon]|nr:Ig-like domain repeat protein [Methanomassiliicoccaceae archaeon]